MIEGLEQICGYNSPSVNIPLAHDFVHYRNRHARFLQLLELLAGIDPVELLRS